MPPSCYFRMFRISVESEVREMETGWIRSPPGPYRWACLNGAGMLSQRPPPRLCLPPGFVSPDSDSLCAFGKPTPFPIRNSAIVAYHHIQARCLAKKCLPFQYLTDYQISNGEIKGHNNFRTGNTEMRGPMEGVGKTYYFPTSTYVI